MNLRSVPVRSETPVRFSNIIGCLGFLIGVLIFLWGFLLNRSEFHNISTFTQSGLRNTSSSGRVIFILADALSYTFVRPESAVLGNPDRFHMPFVTGLLSSSTGLSQMQLFHFIADPPSTTLQRLKALMTGSMPTFVDAGANFGGSELMEDNLIKQWHRAGRRILFVGDDTWNDLFPTEFSESHPYPSFDVRDLDTVDRAVREYVLSQLSDNASNWDVLIGHMLGVDHCGHTYGADHPVMTHKLRELDQLIAQIVDRLRPRDLLIVAGDHGMTVSGNHGGDSPLELDAALLVYQHNVKLGRRLAVQSTKSDLRLSQIDLVPTLACLTGVPVPYSNLGVLVRELIPSEHGFRTCLIENLIQMTHYTIKYRREVGEFGLPDKLTAFIQQQQQFANHSQSELIDAANAVPSEEILSKLHLLQNAYREHWTRFDLTRMWLGACLIISSLLFWFQPSSGISWLLLIGQLGCTVIVVFETPMSIFRLPMIVICPMILSLLTLHCLRSPSVPSKQMNHPIFFIFVLTFVYWSNSFLVNELLVTHFLLQTLVLCQFIRCVLRTEDGNWSTARVMGLCVPIEPVILCLLFRFSLGLEMCREESFPRSICRPATDPWLVKPLGKLSTAEAYSLALWRLLFATGILTAVWIVVRRWLRHTGLVNRWNGTRLAVEALIPLALLLLVVCWILDVAPVALQHSEIVLVPITFLRRLRVTCARLLLLLVAFVFILLIRKPLLTEWMLDTMGTDVKPNRAHVSGRDHAKPIYTGWLVLTLIQLPLLVLLVFLNEVHILSLISIPTVVLLYTSLGPTFKGTRITDTTERENPLCSYLRQVSDWHVTVFLCLLDNWSFYVTGHQPTLADIPWDAAFATYVGDHGTRVLPAVMVLTHLFAGSLLVAASVPMCLTAPLAWSNLRGSDPKRRPRVAEFMLPANEQNALQFVTALDQLSWRLLYTKAVLTMGSVLGVGVLRRHLMMWKIFAPRLIFSIVSFLVSTIALFLVRWITVLSLHRAAVRRCRTVETIQHKQCPTGRV